MGEESRTEMWAKEKENRDIGEILQPLPYVGDI
jgi:hypothetical protein